jgi:predicted AAA+ superfamily ATPase
MNGKMDLIGRFIQDSNQSYFLFGPRGTGKSTWIRQHLPEALVIDLLDPESSRSYSARPERLKEVVEGHPSTETVVIDEIQKIPQLLDVVHLLIESHPHIRFVLTGSSARKLKRSGVDLLAGRAVVKSMHPFMAAELRDEFSLDKALLLGMVPLVLQSENPQETLAGYTTLYVREEVQMEGLVRNVGDFNRFLESASFSHGSVLNMSDVARDCQVGQKAVKGYFSILEDLMLAFSLPVFRKRARRELSAHPKFFFFDAGVFRSLRPAGPLDTPQEIDGAALEGLIAQHLRAWIAYGNQDAKIYFWRTKSGNEVDFVLYGRHIFCAIEVKNTNKLKPRMVSGLSAFRKDYPEANVCLLYRGKERIKMKDVLCVPVEGFLKNLVPGKQIRF